VWVWKRWPRRWKGQFEGDREGGACDDPNRNVSKKGKNG